MQAQKINNAQTQTGVEKKTQDRKDNKANPRYSATVLWQGGCRTHISSVGVDV
jgi:hypothetical protein